MHRKIYKLRQSEAARALKRQSGRVACLCLHCVAQIGCTFFYFHPGAWPLPCTLTKGCAVHCALCLLYRTTINVCSI